MMPAQFAEFLFTIARSTTTRKSGNILLTYLNQSMETSDSDLKVNREFLESVYNKIQNPVLCRQRVCFLIGTLQVNNRS